MTERNKLQSQMNVGLLFKRNLSVCFLLFIVLFGVLFAKNFTTWANVKNLFKQMSVNAVLATGFSICFIADGFDLSQGNVCSLCCCVCATVLMQTNNMILAIAMTLLVGLAFGAFNALVCKFIKGDGNDSYIVTLATSMIALGTAYVYTGGGLTISLDGKMESVSLFRQLSKGTTLGLPNMIYLAALVMLIGAFILKKTKLGRRFYLVGANKTAAYMSGINSHNYRAYAFMISGLCVAIAALITTARNGNANANCCAGFENDAAIATIVGGNAAGNGKSGIVCTVVGVLCLSIMGNVMNLMRIDSTIQTIIKGGVLILGLYAQLVRSRNS